MVPSSTTQDPKERKFELLETCQCGTWQHVLCLLDKGASLHWSDSNNLGVLHYACLGNNYQVAQRMLAHKEGAFMTNVYKRSQSEGETPLLIACRLGHERLAAMLFRVSHTTGLIRTNKKETPLHIASSFGHANVVSRILQLRQDQVRAKDWCGDTPLHRAIRSGHVDVVRILLKNKADVNARNDLLNNPLCQSVSDGQWEIMAMVAQSPKLDIDARGEHNYSAMIVACHLDNAQAVNTLLTCGADPDTAGPSNTTCLQIASAAGMVAIVEALLKAGASVNTVNDVRDTALTLAAFGGFKDVVKLLLAHGSQPKVGSSYDALELATENGYSDIADMIMNHVNNDGGLPSFGNVSTIVGDCTDECSVSCL
ncbi:hypothetical protein ACOMHN_014527 [Nucella lapillus]